MKSFLIMLLLLSGVSIDQPPPGFQLKSRPDAGLRAEAADAGTPAPTVSDYRQELRTSVKQLTAAEAEETGSGLRIKSFAFAQRNVNLGQDAAIVKFTVGPDSDMEFMMIFIRKDSVWQLFPDTFSER